MFKARGRKFVGPKELCMITASFDVQGDRIEYEIHYWGKKFECHPYKHGVIKGDPLQSAAWKKLKTVLFAKYPWDGREFHIDVATGDTGYLPDQVFAFIKALKRVRVAESVPTISTGIRGVATGETLIRWAPESQYKDKYGKTKRRQARYLVNTNIAKDILYKAVKNSMDFKIGFSKTPPEGHHYIWSNKSDSYYDQICSEEAHMVIRDGRPRKQYRKKNDAKPNEILDLWVYNLAMAHKYMTGDLDDEDYWEALASRRRK